MLFNRKTGECALQLFIKEFIRKRGCARVRTGDCKKIFWSLSEFAEESKSVQSLLLEGLGYSRNHTLSAHVLLGFWKRRGHVTDFLPHMPNTIHLCIVKHQVLQCNLIKCNQVEHWADFSLHSSLNLSGYISTCILTGRVKPPLLQNKFASI